MRMNSHEPALEDFEHYCQKGCTTPSKHTDPRLLSEREGELSCSGACSSLSKGFLVSSLHSANTLEVGSFFSKPTSSVSGLDAYFDMIAGAQQKVRLDWEFKGKLDCNWLETGMGFGCNRPLLFREGASVKSVNQLPGYWAA